MNADLLEKIKKLPFQKQKELEDYMDFLLNKYNSSNEMTKEEVGEMTKEEVGEMRMRNMGWAKGQYWMADDFNDTPEDFKDYI